MKKLILVFAILIICNKSNATIYPINFDVPTNVTCQAGDTLRFYTVNWTSYTFDVYINYNIIANNITPGLNGKIYDHVAQISDTSYQLTNSFGLILDRSIIVNNTVSIQNNDSIIAYTISPTPSPLPPKSPSTKPTKPSTYPS